MFVYKKTFIKVVFIVLISEEALASGLILQPSNRVGLGRVDAFGTFPKSTGPLNSLNDSDLKALLEKNGLFVDKNSEVSVHEERNKIDFVCFDCVIRSVDPKLQMASPDNRDRRF